jgi:hypothetical protein
LFAILGNPILTKDLAMKIFPTRPRIAALSRLAAFSRLAILAVSISPGVAVNLTRSIDVNASTLAVWSITGPLNSIKAWSSLIELGHHFRAVSWQGTGCSECLAGIYHAGFTGIKAMFAK